MAPEIAAGTRGQTPQADIWSLFMVLVWIYNFQGFRNATPAEFTVQSLAQLAKNATADQLLGDLKEMARPDPEKRASAAQMMLKLGLFSQEPRAILCSHRKDPRRIPAIPADTPPPSVQSAGQQTGGGLPAMRSQSSDVQMT
ncbi:hypothetical protein diail_1768 [Diaporthe ilicicola]|nr:hypothetical protein diail_1768 [Diaporthe ilicicola]